VTGCNAVLLLARAQWQLRQLRDIRRDPLLVFGEQLAFSHRGQRKAPVLIARIVFYIDIPETVPATGSRRKSRDHPRPHSGRIPQLSGIGSSSTRLREGLSLSTRVHHHKLGWTRFRTTLPPQERRYQISISQRFSSRRSLLVFHCLSERTHGRK
jgi:hypothetical protein